MSVVTQPEITFIAEAIQKYLSEKPSASETLDGVTKWWLQGQHFEHSIQHVKAALNFLLNEGVITKIGTCSGNCIFKLAV